MSSVAPPTSLFTSSTGPAKPHSQTEDKLSQRSQRSPLHLQIPTAAHRQNVVRTSPPVLLSNNPYSEIYHLCIHNPHKHIYDLPALCEPRGAILIPFNKGKIGLQRQYRPIPTQNPANGSFPLDTSLLHERGIWSLEFPRGFPEKDEGAIQTARREAEEELEMEIKRVMPLGWINANTSWCLNDTPVFVGVVGGKRRSYEEEGEVLGGILWCAREDVADIIRGGRIRCGLTLAALSLFLMKDGWDVGQVEGDVYERLARFLGMMFEKGISGVKATKVMLTGEGDKQKKRCFGEWIEVERGLIEGVVGQWKEGKVKDFLIKAGGGWKGVGDVAELRKGREVFQVIASDF